MEIWSGHSENMSVITCLLLRGSRVPLYFIQVYVLMAIGWWGCGQSWHRYWKFHASSTVTYSTTSLPKNLQNLWVRKKKGQREDGDLKLLPSIPCTRALTTRPPLSLLAGPHFCQFYRPYVYNSIPSICYPVPSLTSLPGLSSPYYHCWYSKYEILGTGAGTVDTAYSYR